MILDQHWAREAAAGALNSQWPTSGNSFFDKMNWLIEGAMIFIFLLICII